MAHVAASTGDVCPKAHPNKLVAAYQSKAQFINNIMLRMEGLSRFMVRIAVTNPKRMPDRAINPLMNSGSISMSLGVFHTKCTIRNG